MKLANATLRPGKVIEVLENGCILAEVPGLFSAVDKDNLPPIMPFLNYSENSYSKPKVYQEVWVLNLLDNPQQLYWFRKDNIVENNSDLLNQENVEVICNREAGMGWATIYFSDGSGWVIQKEDSIIQIKPDGSIIMKMDWPHRAIEISNNGINIGTEGGSEHPATYGDKVEDIFVDICALLQTIQTVSSNNPYTITIASVISSQLPGIQKKIGTISSQHVYID